MQIHGLNKTTLLDYPEHIAATVFTGGCNFRCPFCHNGDLVLRAKEVPLIPEEEVFAYLEKRKGILEGVCITGGEPTLQKDLSTFICRVKALGYLVKLDTNGYKPEVLRELLAEGLLDYVAMDVKASLQNYGRAVGASTTATTFDTSPIEESIGLLKKSSIPYEFRTTVVKGIHREEEFEEIGRLLSGCHAYYIQSYRHNENVIAPGYTEYSVEELRRMSNRAKKYIDKVELRGVE